MLREGSVSPLLKRKSLMTKSPSFWFGQLLVWAKAGAVMTSRAAARAGAREIIGISPKRGRWGRKRARKNGFRPEKLRRFGAAEKAAAALAGCESAVSLPPRPRKSRPRMPFCVGENHP